MKTLVFTIAPNGDRRGIWLDGFLLEEPGDEAAARSSVAMRIQGVTDRGDTGQLVVAKAGRKPRRRLIRALRPSGSP